MSLRDRKKRSIDRSIGNSLIMSKEGEGAVSASANIEIDKVLIVRTGASCLFNTVVSTNSVSGVRCGSPYKTSTLTMCGAHTIS